MTTSPFDYGDMSPANTRRAVALAAEAVRYVNTATLEAGGISGIGGLPDVDVMVADLELVMERLPQLLARVGAGLVAEARAGRVEVVSGRFAGRDAAAVTAVAKLLAEASGHVVGAQQVLHDARQITAALAVRDEDR